MKEEFITNIKKLRTDFKLSQPQLAKETGFSNGIISLWETGLRIPNANAVITLSRYFQVTTDYLLNVSNDNTPVYRSDDLYSDMKELNKRLKELRLKNNLSQGDLAKNVNLTQSAINHWEIGNRTPNAKAVVALANYFEVTTDYLLGESD